MWTPSSLIAGLLALLSPAGPAPEPARSETAVEAPATEAPAPAPAVEIAEAAPPAPVQLAKAGKSDASLAEVVRKLQKKYEGTTDFSASFDQRFTYTVMRRTQESQGTVMFKKPGLMRWDYSTPSPKIFSVADDKLTIWQKKDHTVMVDHCFKQDGLTASVSFLWGAGKIHEQFEVEWFKGVFGDKTDHHLQLTPKQKNSVFHRLILVVDPESYLVKQSVLVDPQGNVNQFMFDDIKLNRGLKKSAFELELPKGLEQSRIPGSCDPNARQPGLE